MALEKTITYDNGTESTYHRISRIEFDYMNYGVQELPASGSYFVARVGVSSYKDKTLRDNKIHSSITNNMERYIVSSSINFDRTAAYEKLKLTSTFTGSIDV